MHIGMFHVIGEALIHLVIGTVTLVMLYWVYVTGMKSPKTLSVDDFTCMIYLMTCVVVKVCSYVTIASDLLAGQPIQDLTDFTPQKLSLMIYAYTFLNIIFTIVPGRISRFEAISHMVSFLLFISTYTTVHTYTLIVHTYIVYIPTRNTLICVYYIHALLYLCVYTKLICICYTYMYMLYCYTCIYYTVTCVYRILS